MKVVNYIKNSALYIRLFAQPCEYMRAAYTSFLWYWEVRRLSSAKVIQKVQFLPKKIIIRLQICVEMIIFLLNLLIWWKYLEIGKSMQDEGIHKKMEIWKTNLEKNLFDMFPLLNLCAQINIEANKNGFVEHVDGLLIHFWNYFNDLDFTKYVWIQNLFIDEKND